ncbi:MAG: factor-independent urate hydroxylase [Thermomicrobiales bacterium]
MRYEISYGKKAVPVYRVYAKPLRGVAPIPESRFTGRSNVLMAAEVDVTILGSDFLPAYLVGDNSNVVATDSMKNIIIDGALAFEGSTLEHYLFEVGSRFIGMYEQIREVRLEVRELAFPPVEIPDATGAFDESDRLFARSGNDSGLARLHLLQEETGIEIVDHEMGRIGFRLLKVTGSSFTSFVRDEHTTLPDRKDRPLFVFLDLFWKYGNTDDAVTADIRHYVPGEQIADLVSVVFHEFVSESIQHLVHEIGTRVLERFPQLSEVRFVAENRTRDPFGQSPARPEVRVYSDPFPAFGEITLTMRRS